MKDNDAVAVAAVVDVVESNPSWKSTGMTKARTRNQHRGRISSIGPSIASALPIVDGCCRRYDSDAAASKSNGRYCYRNY